MADIIEEDLWGLAVDAQYGEKSDRAHINRCHWTGKAIGAWYQAEALARRTSVNRGLPFEAFHPLLAEARRIVEVYRRVVERKEPIHFADHIRRGRFPSGICDLLRDLGLTWEGNAGNGTGTTQTPKAVKRPMSVEEANDKALELAENMKEAFCLRSLTGQAKAIGCHLKTWKKAPHYPEVQKIRARLLARAGRKKGTGSPSVIGLTEAVEAIHGNG
jgi:hypothetical protein